uniref:Uncharacterized protein n=1 Tax=Tetranychus urticae TaxID=32264 RepID=T1K0E2_TETUR
MISKCEDVHEPSEYKLFDRDGNTELTAVFAMGWANAFEPSLSLELIDNRPIRLVWWMLKLEQGKETQTGSLAIGNINKPSEVEITLSNLDRDKTVAVNDLPIYRWSYARYCNKTIYDVGSNMITLKKENDSFEFFIYRLSKYEDKKPRHVTLINSKNSSISISCDYDRNDVIVSTKMGSKEDPVLNNYIFRKHIDGLRCGIFLAIKLRSEYSSFSFDDTPLKLIYKADDSDNIMTQLVKFDSDPITVDKFKIETSSTASVDQHESDDPPKIEITSTLSVDQNDVSDQPRVANTTPASVNQHDVDDENQDHDRVNPLIGIFLTAITVFRSYLDLW